MKVLLTVSPISLKRGDGPLSLRTSSSYFYLGSMLHEQPAFGLDKVADVRIEDINARTPEEFEQIVRDYDPDIVGTSVYEFNWQMVRDLVLITKSAKPSVLFAVGGQTPTKIPKSILRMTGADIAFRGEADFTFRQAVESLSHGNGIESLLDVDGVVVQSGSQPLHEKPGKILYGSNSLKIPWISQSDLRNIRLDFGIMAEQQQNLQYQSIDFVSSRGCPNHTCSFCQFSSTDNGYRALSQDQVIESIREIRGLPGVKYLVFGDAVFGTNRKGAKSLMGRLDKEDFGFEVYHGEFSVDQFLQPGDFGSRKPDTEMMRKALAISLCGELGVEHLSDGGLQKYNKFRYTAKEAMDVMEAMVGNGMMFSPSFIHFGTETTKEDLAEHFANLIHFYDLAYGVEGISLGSGTMSPLPYIGTREYDKILKRMHADPIYGYITKRTLEHLDSIYELPEDDGYPYMFSLLIPFDYDIFKSTYDLVLFTQATSADFQDRQEMFNIFYMINHLKDKIPEGELRKRFESIRPNHPKLDAMHTLARVAYENSVN